MRQYTGASDSVELASIFSIPTHELPSLLSPCRRHSASSSEAFSDVLRVYGIDISFIVENRCFTLSYMHAVNDSFVLLVS
jgi:hypothetical protein